MAVENTVATCAAPGCELRARCRGLCRGHYRRWLKTGRVDADVPLRVGYGPRPDRTWTCSVPACSRRAVKHGLCDAHFWRWKARGDVYADVPIGALRPLRSPGRPAWREVREGQEFGLWTVLRNARGVSTRAACRCSCGTMRTVHVGSLLAGYSRSCGCGTDHHGHATGYQKHGHATGSRVSPTYTSWKKMLCRCRNPRDGSFPAYGGVGITVCARWDSQQGGSFSNFLADMGERPPDPPGWRGKGGQGYYTLDRIDGDGNYEPGNCRWATPREQSLNQRRWRPAAGVV